MNNDMEICLNMLEDEINARLNKLRYMRCCRVYAGNANKCERKGETGAEE